MQCFEEKMLKIIWKKLLISKGNQELCRLFELKSLEEIYKIKRFASEDHAEQYSLFGIVYFLTDCCLEQKNFPENKRLSAILNSEQFKGYKVAKTNLSVVDCDQILKSELGYEHDHTLLCIQQMIKVRSKVVCVAISYLDAEKYQLQFDKVLDLIW